MGILSLCARWSPDRLVPAAGPVAGSAHARTAVRGSPRVTTPVATLEAVRVQLDWPADAPQGRLRLQAGRLTAPDLGYRFANRTGPAHSAGRAGRVAFARALRDGAAVRRPCAWRWAPALPTWVRRGASRLQYSKNAPAPDITRIDLARVPLPGQALLAQLAGRQSQVRHAGRQLRVTAPANAPLRVTGPLRCRRRVRHARASPRRESRRQARSGSVRRCTRQGAVDGQLRAANCCWQCLHRPAAAARANCAWRPLQQGATGTFLSSHGATTRSC